MLVPSSIRICFNGPLPFLWQVNGTKRSGQRLLRTLSSISAFVDGEKNG
jgi:hypothetical protein